METPRSKAAKIRLVLICALAGSLLLNLGLIMGGAREWRARYAAEVELAKLKHPMGPITGPTPGAAASPSASAGGGAGSLAGGSGTGSQMASGTVELLRERNARLLAVQPTSPVFELGDRSRPGAAHGRIIVGERGAAVLASFQHLPRPPAGQALRIWVWREGSVAQHVGVLAVDGRGKGEGLYPLAMGTRIVSVELRQEPTTASTRAPGGTVILASKRPAGEGAAPAR